MGNFKYTFPSILIFLGVLFSVLIIENVGFFTNDPAGTLSDNYFLFIFIIATLCFAFAFLFEHIMNHTKVDFVILTWCLLFFVVGMVSIITFKNYRVTNGGLSDVVIIDDITKLRYAGSFALFCLSVYGILFIFAKNLVTPRRLIPVYIIIIIICYASVVASIFMDMEGYKEIFERGTASIQIKAFYWNPNMLAGTMMMGMAASFIVNIYKRNVFSFISIFVFFAVILFVNSSISILAGGTVLLLYFLFEAISALKRNMVLGLVSIAIYIFGITAMVCIVAIALSGDTLGSFSKMIQYIYNDFQTSSDTFSGRVHLWEFAVERVQEDNMKFLFGFGFGISKDVVNTWVKLEGGAATSVHNGVLQILFNFGILGIALYGAFLLLTFYSIIRLLKRAPRFAIIFLFVELIMLGYSFGESVIYFNSNAQGILVGTLFYLPVLMRYKNEKHKEYFEHTITPTLSMKSMNGRLLVKSVSAFIISLVVAIAPFVFLDAVKENEIAIQVLYTLLICLGVSFVFFPYLVYLWHKDTAIKSFRIRVILNLLVVFTILGFSVGFYLLFNEVTGGTYLWYFPTVLAVTLLIEVIYYSIIKKPSFRVFLSTFTSLFVTFVAAIIASALSISIVVFWFKQGVDFGTGFLIYALIFLFNIIMFYVFAVLFMFKDTKAIIDYFEMRYKNETCLALLKDRASEK